MQTRTRLAYFPNDPFNPYQRSLYRDLQGAGIDVVPDARFKLFWLARHRRDTEVLHLHWPQALYRVRRRPRWIMRHLSVLKFVYFIVRLVEARALGYRLVWTVHQVYPHEIRNRALDRVVPLILSRTCDVLLAHDEHTANNARTHLRISRNAIHVVPHPSYVGAYPELPAPEVARSELCVSKASVVFLCFGGVRGYKNIDVLLDAFASLRVVDAALVIAGLPADKKLARRIRTAADCDCRIRPLLQLVSEQDVPKLFAASDVAVLPRGDGGTSGALILAVGMGVPVIAAKMPANEAITHGDTAAWLFLPDDRVSLRACLASAAMDPETRRRKAAGARRLSPTLGWDHNSRVRTARIIRGELLRPGQSAP
jgi:beta-1,4-mannosyltransferase